MSEVRLGAVERRFAEMIWQYEPVATGFLVKRCAEVLQWKRTTTYTVLKRLCERGLFQNTDGIVTSLISREEFDTMQSRRFVEDTFAGSLPAFLAAFSGGEKLSGEEIDQLQRLIDEHRR